MKKVINYFSESYQEMVENVTWPTWKQAQEHGLLVLAGTVFFALLVWGADKGLDQIMGSIYKQ